MGLLNEDGEINDRDRYHIPRFLNRLLSLDCDRQNALFAYYSNLFDQCVAHAKASGTFDHGVQDIKALSINARRRTRTCLRRRDHQRRDTSLHACRRNAINTRNRRTTRLRYSNTALVAFYRQTNGNIILVN